MDHNRILKHEIIGCCFFRLKLIMDGHFHGKSIIEAYLISEEEMKTAINEGDNYSNEFYDRKGHKNETTKDLGKLSLSSTLKKVNRQSEMIPANDMILKQI